jgi:hypothetical protein
MPIFNLLNPFWVLRQLLNAALTPVPRFTAVNGRAVPCREGGWVVIGAAALGAATSIYEGNKASNSANDALNQNKSVEQQQLDLANEQNTRSQALFNRYMQTYVPIQNAYIKQLTTPVNANVVAGQAKADVEQAAAGQRAVAKRNSMALGIDPNSGRAQEMNRESQIDTAAASAGAATSARRWAQQENLRRQGIAAGLGEGLIGEAGSFANGAAAGLGGVANNDMQLGGMYAGEANTDMGAAGGALGTILNHFYPGGNYGIEPTTVQTASPSGDTPIPVDTTPTNIPPPVSPVTPPNG